MMAPCRLNISERYGGDLERTIGPVQCSYRGSHLLCDSPELKTCSTGTCCPFRRRSLSMAGKQRRLSVGKGRESRCMNVKKTSTTFPTLLSLTNGREERSFTFLQIRRSCSCETACFLQHQEVNIFPSTTPIPGILWEQFYSGASS